MAKITVNRPCIVCGKSESDPLFDVAYPQFNYPGVFQLRRCRSCRLIFNSPRLEDAEIAALYSSEYYYFHKTEAEMFQRSVDLYRRTLGLTPALPTPSRLLEIGCAKGYFLSVLRELGHEVEGIEISAAAAEFARSHFGLSVHAGSLSDYPRVNDSSRFDAVLALDLIEHVTDPPAFLARVADLVKPSGRLYLDTPNGQARAIETQQGAWPGFNPYHIYLFTPATLEQLLAAAGFEVIRIISYSNAPSAAAPAPAGGLARLKPIYHLLPPAFRKAVSRTLFPDRRPRSSSEAAEKTRELPPYTDTADSRGPLAAGREGENLIVVARRKP